MRTVRQANAGYFVFLILLLPLFNPPAIAASPQRQPDASHLQNGLFAAQSQASTTPHISASTQSSLNYSLHDPTNGTLSNAVLVSPAVITSSLGQSFTLSASPSSLILRQAGNGLWNTSIINLYISPVSGFTGNVSLSVGTSSPPGPVAVISPSQILVTANKTYSAALSFQGAFLSGTWQFGITAVSRSLSVSTSVSVDFIPSYFYVGTSPSCGILVPSGSSAHGSLNLVSVNGFDSNVSFSYYSVYALPSNPPTLSFSPASLTLIPNGTMRVAVTASTSSNTPTGSYTFIIVVHAGWATADAQVNVYVVSHDYTPGVRIGTTATYSVSFSSLPGASITVRLLVTNVTGPVVYYNQELYVNNVHVNTTANSINVVTGDHSGTIYIPFPFVSAGLSKGDTIFPAYAYGSISITSTSTATLAGSSRLTLSAGTQSFFDPVQFTATWDRNTGILGILDGNVPINSTTVTAHYSLTSTNAWSGFLVSFTVSPITPQQFSTVTFTPTITGGTAPYKYDWDFGDGQSSTLSSPTHRYIISGTYHVTLTISDRDGQVRTQTSTVKISSSPLNIRDMIATLVNRFGTTQILLISLTILGVGAVVISTTILLVVRRNRLRRPAPTKW